MNLPKHHALSYIEFGVTRKFYESAFGWEFNDYGPAYSGIKSPDGEGEVGGLNPQAEPLRPPYEFPGGRRFEFLDPSGNRLGIFAAA